jgi:hypothetical protein
MAKWAARFGLGLSTTTPGIRLCASRIYEEPDIGSVHSVLNPGLDTDSVRSVANGFGHDGRLWIYQSESAPAALYAQQMEGLPNRNTVPSRRGKGWLAYFLRRSITLMCFVPGPFTVATKPSFIARRRTDRLGKTFTGQDQISAVTAARSSVTDH